MKYDMLRNLTFCITNENTVVTITNLPTLRGAGGGGCNNEHLLVKRAGV